MFATYCILKTRLNNEICDGADFYAKFDKSANSP